MHRNITIAILLALPFSSCTGFDFFGYQNKTGLYALERPEGYDSAKLGIEMAPTGTEDYDLLAASGGQGTATVFYKMSEDGNLRNVADPFDIYMGRSAERKVREQKGTGVSLAGLPRWRGMDTGCVAIGESLMKQVVLRCVSDPGTDNIIRFPASMPGVDLSDFGHEIAAIRPQDSGPWLLAIAARRHMWVVSDHLDEESKRSDAFLAETGAGLPAGDIESMTAGRIDERFYVAALITDPVQEPRVFVFVQDAGGAKTVSQKLCLDHPSTTAFSGGMTTGDIDDDGADELVISAGLGPVGTKEVYVYDIAALLAGAGDPQVATCDGALQTPRFVLTPEEGDLKIDCGDSCHFGAALAVGDISTEDSYAEIVVGAPEATVRGKTNAGGVYIYSVTDWARGEAELASQVSHSSPSKGHWFGGGVAIAPIAGRNELVIATTSKGNLYVAFCSGVGQDINAGADVPTNSGGSVVSTRCRL